MSASAERALVVGGGIIGMACAYFLRREGLAVTLLDQGRLGGACSAGNCGLVCPGHVLPLTLPGAPATALRSLFDRRAAFRVRLQWRAELYRWFWEFSRRCTTARALAAAAELQRILDASAEEYRRLLREEALDAEYRATGTLYVFRSASALEHFATADVQPLETFGVRIRRLAGEELAAFDPSLRPGLAGGFLFEDDAFVNPGRLCRSWARRIAEQGVTVLEQQAMTGLARNGRRITGITTAAGTLQADHYVFALGAWSRRLGAELGIELPVEPGKGYSIMLNRPAPCPGLPILFPETRVVATPFADGLRLGSIMEFAGFDRSLPRARLQQLLDSAAPYIALPANPAWRDAWYGWRPMTWDSLPIIGRTRAADNASIATGHNMLGTTLAPATGRLVADFVMERRTFIDAGAYSPDRF
jgi:D-amino-acid dehydrogenase